MKKYNSKSGYGEIAIGKLLLFTSFLSEQDSSIASTPEAEIFRLNEAIDKSLNTLSELTKASSEKVGLDNSTLFEVEKVLLEDPEYIGVAKELIKAEGISAKAALIKAKEHAVNTISEKKDAFVKERIDDIEDVTAILLENLENKNSSFELVEDTVLVAKDIKPSEFIKLNKKYLKGIVFENKSETSHVGILAKASGIPALFGTEAIEEIGSLSIIDAGSKLLIVEPDTETLKEFERIEGMEEVKRDIINTKELKVKVCANIEGFGNDNLDEADGIGLFRTEYLFLERENPPSEEEQFKEYKKIVEAMGGRPVTIRFCDLGADKKVSYIDFGDEKNPALGFRGIRVLLAKKELFITQICAALRAACFGPVKVMFPMINSVTEVKEGKALIDKAKEVLRSRGEAFGSIDTGAMIETPAAALLSDEISKEVDFMSIGTNDLSQFTLAIDRENTKCEGHTDSENKAVMRLIKMVVDAGKKNNCKTTICGELAADVSISGELLKFGVDELSVSPLFIPKVKEKIRNLG